MPGKHGQLQRVSIAVYGHACCRQFLVREKHSNELVVALRSMLQSIQPDRHGISVVTQEAVGIYNGAIFHFSSGHLSSYVIPISLLEEVTSILHVWYGHHMESKAPKSSALLITHHSVKGMTRT